MRQMQIQTTKLYRLYDVIRIKKKGFTPSDMNFKTILMPKGILAKILSQKSYSYLTFLT